MSMSMSTSTSMSMMIPPNARLDALHVATATKKESLQRNGESAPTPHISSLKQMDESATEAIGAQLIDWVETLVRGEE